MRIRTARCGKSICPFRYKNGSKKEHGKGPAADTRFAAAGRDAKTPATLNAIMSGMISVLDTSAGTRRRKNFYHGLLLGLLRSIADWKILSNARGRRGDSAISSSSPRRRSEYEIVIEIKYAPTFRALDEACAKAMEQIKARGYDERLREDGREDILAYGIAFNKKRCKAVCERL